MFSFVAATFLVSLIAQSSAQPSGPTGTQCPPIAGPSCACETADGQKYDLSALANQGSPKFTNIGPDQNDYVYDYNPCSTFNSDNGGCTNAFICQTANSDPDTSYQVADAGTEQIWIDTDGTPYLFYTSLDGFGTARQAQVFLDCQPDLTDGNEEFTTDGDSVVSLEYVFHLKSCYACAGGCGGSGPGGGSGGSIAGVIGIVIIILAIGGLVTYFIIGAVIMKVKFKASGSDIIPNKTFWISLPGLIKDGCMFTLSPCLGAARRRKGYESAS